ncbi:MAG: glycosyltransferase family 4 protein [Chloroflexota bacterium]|nr:glycosyltransferase family 4 protein [Chloroflexota bacterium]
MRIVVDLTPVLPGGQNGGLKPLVLSLLRELIALAPHVEFVLLTSSATDAELAPLDAENARRLCVVGPIRAAQAPASRRGNRVSLRRRVRLRMTRILPPRLMLWIELAYLATVGRQPKGPGLLTRLGANLLFSPFANLSFHEPGVPSVSLIHNLQVYQYPRFFGPEERSAQHKELQRTVRLSDRVVCTSAFVYRTILDKTDVSTARVVTIQPRTMCRLGRVEEHVLPSVLGRLGVERDEFLLYPGTFLPHKNHRMLFTAFGVCMARDPGWRLKLVCPGDRSAGFDELVHTIRTMGLEDSVVLPGFVSDTDLAALYQSCRAVIVPSLYAGLSLAVIEAIAFHAPLLCAGHPSLQEAAGEAAMYFDPVLLADVVRAIELAARGPSFPQRVAGADDMDVASGHPMRTAEEYLRLLSEVAA